MNKRGISDIVATISLVLLTTTAAVMLSGFVMTLINPDEQLAPQFSCFEYQTEQLVQARSACYNAETGDIAFTVQRKVSAIDLPEIDFTINTNSGSESYTSRNCANCNVLDIGDTKTYYFAWDSFSEGEAIVRVGDCALDRIAIRPAC